MASIQPYVEENSSPGYLALMISEADYDDFIAELKARGIDRALEINQKAYDNLLRQKLIGDKMPGLGNSIPVLV